MKRDHGPSWLSLVVVAVLITLVVAPGCGPSISQTRILHHEATIACADDLGAVMRSCEAESLSREACTERVEASRARCRSKLHEICSANFRARNVCR